MVNNSILETDLHIAINNTNTNQEFRGVLRLCYRKFNETSIVLNYDIFKLLNTSSEEHDISTIKRIWAEPFSKTIFKSTPTELLICGTYVLGSTINNTDTYNCINQLLTKFSAENGNMLTLNLPNLEDSSKDISIQIHAEQKQQVGQFIYRFINDAQNLFNSLDNELAVQTPTVDVCELISDNVLNILPTKFAQFIKTNCAYNIDDIMNIKLEFEDNNITIQYNSWIFEPLIKLTELSASEMCSSLSKSVINVFDVFSKCLLNWKELDETDRKLVLFICIYSLFIEFLQTKSQIPNTLESDNIKLSKMADIQVVWLNDAIKRACMSCEFKYNIIISIFRNNDVKEYDKLEAAKKIANEQFILGTVSEEVVKTAIVSLNEASIPTQSPQSTKLTQKSVSSIETNPLTLSSDGSKLNIPEILTQNKNSDVLINAIYETDYYLIHSDDLKQDVISTAYLQYKLLDKGIEIQGEVNTLVKFYMEQLKMVHSKLVGSNVELLTNLIVVYNVILNPIIKHTVDLKTKREILFQFIVPLLYDEFEITEFVDHFH